MSAVALFTAMGVLDTSIPIDSNETYQLWSGRRPYIVERLRTSLRTCRNINIVVSSAVMTDILDGGREHRNHIGIEWTRNLLNKKSTLQIVGLGIFRVHTYCS